MAMTGRQHQALRELTTRGVLPADQDLAVRQALEDTGQPARVAELAAYVPSAVGVALSALGLIGTFLSLVDGLRPKALALASGAATALFGARQPLGSNARATYALAAGLAVACFAVHLGAHSTVLLVAGVVATTVVVPEVVWNPTDGAVTAPHPLRQQDLAPWTTTLFGHKLSV